jgi:hypothetical protein
MSAPLNALAGGAITVAAAIGIGTLLVGRAGLRLTRLEFRLFAFLAGSACLSTLMLLLASLQLARKGAVLMVAGTSIVLAWRRRNPAVCDASPPAPRALLVLFCAVTLPFLVLYLFTAWAPEVSPDGSAYHLGNVVRYWAHHGLFPIRDMYGALPEGLEMLFLAAFTIGRHPAAALVHLAFLMALPLLLISFSQRYGFPKAGLLAAVLVFASPVVGKDGASAYNDVALATVAFGVVYAMELWRETGDIRLLSLAGLLAGFCFGIKYTGFVAALYALLLIGPRRRPLLRFAVPCALLVVPWLVKNTVYLHNPVSPFFNSAFPNPYVSAKFEKDYSRGMMHTAGTTNPRELAFAYTFFGGSVCGFFGPLFLLAPLGIAAARQPRGGRLLLAGTLFAVPAIFNGGTRFLIPAAPCLALAVGLSVAGTRFAVPALMLLHGFVSWPSVAKAYCAPYAWRLEGAPLRAALSSAAVPAYLREHLGAAFEMARILERQTPPGSRIFCFNAPPQAYTERDISVSYQSLEGNALGDMLWTAMERQRQPRRRIVLAFPPLMARRLRVELRKPRPEEIWRVHEFRVRNGGHELARSPAWRIHAHPNPWEAPFAFDNSPVSKWSTEQYGARGAFLEVDFGQPLTVDSVVLECPEDAPLELVARADGAPLHTAIQSTAVDPPAGMRRASVEMLKRYGFHYLVISDGDYYADDYRKYPAFWGLHSAARAGDWTLYQLE